MLVMSSLDPESMCHVSIHFACCLKHWVLCTEVDELKDLSLPLPTCCFLSSFLFGSLAVYPRNVAATVNMGRSSAGRSEKETLEGKWEAAVS